MTIMLIWYNLEKNHISYHKSYLFGLNLLKRPSQRKEQVNQKAKSKPEPFIWTDDEVELLVRVTKE